MPCCSALWQQMGLTTMRPTARHKVWSSVTAPTLKKLGVLWVPLHSGNNKHITLW